MKTLGIITEYNPFHNGHKYHLDQSLKKSNSNFTVCIMSGHFLQRGIPSIMDKWTRSKNAIENGVDLVIELPVIYSLNSAEFFSHGAIRILDSLNIVDTVIFGSENGDINPFLKIGKIYSDEPKEFKEVLKNKLNEGVSFPRAREFALNSYLNKDISIKNQPNNILGIEYSKAIFNINSKITLDTIHRISSEYHEEELTGEISSATAIRKNINELKNLKELKSVIPLSTYNSLLHTKDDLIFRDDFEDLIFYKIRSMSTNELKEIHDVNEGLENRIKEKALISESLEELIQNIKTKRYTYTKIQRILFKALLNIKKEDVHKNPKYIRILGFNKKGQKLIRAMNEHSDLPIITNLKNYIPQDSLAKKMIEKDVLSTNIYNLAKNKKTGNLDYLNKPVIIK